jgi:arabinogalactan endo-1,4-beta-galactosidase
MDVSTLNELEKCGAKFYDQGREMDLFALLASYHVNYVRLRLWNDPYSEDGKPYGGGTNDLAVTIALAKRAKACQMDFLLDYHYSDFWADPGKQFKPKAWKDYDNEALERAVYEYTKETLLALGREGVMPTMVQVGNEITNGLLWPNGKLPEYDVAARFVSAGIRAVREVDPKILVMIHLDNGGNNEMYRNWLDHYMERGEDFDVLGLSYYPFWHGGLDGLSANMRDMAERYGKTLVVVETSMGHTLEDYHRYEGLADDEQKETAAMEELASKSEYPMTIEGQCDFLQDLLQRIAEVKGGRGFFYWEPAWLPVKGSGWATPESLAYIGEKGSCGNGWANQALFDYRGNALPSLRIVRDFH